MASVSNMYDGIVVGAGHNGLVCACYLAQAGQKVLVLERRASVGGAVSTETMWDGYRMDLGSSVHLMFPRTGIAGELNLEKHGLHYIEMNPWAALPLPGGRALFFYRDLEQTCASIAQFSKADADAYRSFVTRWLPVSRGVLEAFQKPPTMANFGRHVFLAKSPGKGTADTLRQITSGYGRLLHETFSTPEMRAAMGWLAAQSGPPPGEPGTGPFAAWWGAVHESGAWRARGGSGMLSVALHGALESMGGTVVTDAAVERIVVENGKVVGVNANGETYRARAVVGACHVKTTFGMLAPSDVPGDLLRKLDAVNIGNGFGMTVRGAASELPDYGAGQPTEVHNGMQLLCPTPEFLTDAYSDYAGGRPSAKPPVLAMTFSAIDPTLAPAGKHTVQLWAQYFPYTRRDGKTWENETAREEAAQSILETLYSYAPNMRGKIGPYFIQSPLDLERDLGLLRGNVMHLEMSLDQMFAFRPLPEMSEYKTPLPGLFLCGASTHPGGGVFGASGRSAARVVLSALKKTPPRPSPKRRG